MERKNNYAIMTRQAQDLFLTYDQDALISKLHLQSDADYFYPTLFGRLYRLSRRTGDLQRQEGNAWVNSNSFGEVLTLLDLICDSKETRSITGQYRTLHSFGMRFHQNKAGNWFSASAAAFDKDLQGFSQACLAIGGKPYPGGDASFVLPVFEELTMVIQFWQSDDEFPPQLCYLWDSNADQYLRYETMYYAIGVLEDYLLSLMEKN